MEKMLVKLSRRRGIMVPAVTLLAIGIGIGGYYIQDRQIAAREQAEQAQEVAERQPKPVDDSKLSTQETVEESTKITEDGQAAEVINVEFEVANDPENSEVILTAGVDTSKVGTCVFYLKQGNYGPEETVSVKDKKCQARLQNPGIGVWEAKVLYTSEDGITRGDAKQDVKL